MRGEGGVPNRNRNRNPERDHRAPARFASALFIGILAIWMAVPATMLMVPSASEAAPPAGFETRAIWVVRHALTTPGRVVQIATEMNANTVLAQVRGRGDAFYKSDLAPLGESMGGSPQGFDPLDRMIQRAHAAGLEAHAWINVYLVWSAGAPP